MIGLAVVFHVVSAVALAGLVVGILRFKAERDFLRHLMDCSRRAKVSRRVWVGKPGILVGRAAAVLGIPREGVAYGTGSQGAVRIEFGPFMELFMHNGISLLKWTSLTEQGHAAVCGLDIVLADGTITAGTSNDGADANSGTVASHLAAAEAAIQKSFGGRVQVRILQSDRAQRK